jgi:hypothetical protein
MSNHMSVPHIGDAHLTRAWENVSHDSYRSNDFVLTGFHPLAPSRPTGKIEPLYRQRTEAATARVQV